VKGKTFKHTTQIRDELLQIEKVINNINSEWNGFLKSGEDAYLKAVAYDLHGLYSGIERIFLSVANTIDNNIPKGDNWHKELLIQMGKEVKGIRPALIDEDTITLLDEFLRFRHRVRNIYSFNLIPDRIQRLVEKLPEINEKVMTSLENFAEFLETLTHNSL